MTLQVGCRYSGQPPPSLSGRRGGAAPRKQRRLSRGSGDEDMHYVSDGRVSDGHNSATDREIDLDGLAACCWAAGLRCCWRGMLVGQT